MPDVSILASLVRENPRTFEELELRCIRFIDAWQDAGGEFDDAEISLFYSLWAQSLDERGKDEAGFFDWAYPQFIQACEKVKALLRAASPRI